jgi:hypothetical protein
MKKNILLVEPDYDTKYPPLGLLKRGTWYRANSAGDVHLVRGCVLMDVILPGFTPDQIYITSLWTWAYQAVWDAIRYYHTLFPTAYITVGGIYASLHAKEIQTIFPYATIETGTNDYLDSCAVDYSLLNEVPMWQNWDKSILFISRGCIRHCPWCVVPQMEGNLRQIISDIDDVIYPGHREVILWDNNILALPNIWNILHQLKDTGLVIQFNQGVDARLMTEDIATLLADINMPILHMAYDRPEEGYDVEDAVNLLRDAGMRSRKIVLYSLYNYSNPANPASGDTPQSFLSIVRHALNMGVSCYPMQYQPLTGPGSRVKNSYISPNWSRKQLRMVAETRGNFGGNGSIYPSETARKIMNTSTTFEQAFDYLRVSQ